MARLTFVLTPLSGRIQDVAPKFPGHRRRHRAQPEAHSWRPGSCSRYCWLPFIIWAPISGRGAAFALLAAAMPGSTPTLRPSASPLSRPLRALFPILNYTLILFTTRVSWSPRALADALRSLVCQSSGTPPNALRWCDMGTTISPTCSSGRRGRSSGAPHHIKPYTSRRATPAGLISSTTLCRHGVQHVFSWQSSSPLRRR